MFPGKVFQRPFAAAGLRQQFAFLAIGQRPAQVQRTVHGIFEDVSILHVCADAVQHRLPGHRREHLLRRRAVQRQPGLPRHRKVGRQIGIPAVGRAAVALRVGGAAVEPGVGKVQLEGRGMLKRPADRFQHHAHLDALLRRVGRAGQQRADQRDLLRLRQRRFRHGQKVNIAGLPAKASEGDRAVRIESRQLVPQYRPKIGAQRVEKRVFVHPLIPPG